MQGHHLLQRKRGLCYAIRAKANSFKISTELHVLVKALSCVLYYCYYHKVSFAIRRVLFAENLKKKKQFSSALGKIYLILLKYPKKGQYRRICRSIFVDENLREQLAEIGQSADCALHPCQLEMEDCCTVHCTHAGHVERISCQKKHKSGKGIRISSEYCSRTKLQKGGGGEGHI